MIRIRPLARRTPEIHRKIAKVDTPDQTLNQKVRRTFVQEVLTHFFRALSAKADNYTSVPIRANTISSIIFECIEPAGIDRSVFTARSCRGASCSKAYTAGLALTRVLEQGR